MTAPHNDNELSRQKFLDEQKRSSLDLMRWVETHPEFTDLQDRASSLDEPLSLSKPPWWKKYLVFLRRSVHSDYNDFIGPNYSHPEMLAEAKTVSNLSSIANLINTVTTFPLIMYIFSGVDILIGLNGAGLALSLLLSTYVNSYSNKFAESACRGRVKSSFWVSLGGCLSMNLLLTLTAGPGMELMQNQKELARIKSQELIEEKVLDYSLQEERIVKLQTIAKEAKEKCDEGMAELESMSPEDPDWDYKNLTVRGRYNEDIRGFDYDSELKNKPFCIDSAEKEENANTLANEIESERSAKEEEIRSYASATLYLKEVRPDIYQEHFNSNGHIRSGLEASQIAIENFTGKLSSGKIAALGLPGITFALSFITSSFAVAKIGIFSQRVDVLLSWDEEAFQLREAMCYQVIQGIHEHYDTLEGRELDITSHNSNGKVISTNELVKNFPLH